MRLRLHVESDFTLALQSASFIEHPMGQGEYHPGQACRIVVTGLGIVSALGQDLSQTWTSLIAGEDGLREIDFFDTHNCSVHHAYFADLPALPGYSPKKISRLSRTSRLSLAAAREALGHAALLGQDGKSLRPEMTLSTGAVGYGIDKVQDYLVLAGKKQPGQFACLTRIPAHQQLLDLQDYCGLTGPSLYNSNSCSGGAHAIGHAADLLRLGWADCILAGGAESLALSTYVGFDCLASLSPDRCRPFDQNRKGLILGEGAAFMVLETETSAKTRKAPILAQLAGYGHALDTHHLTQPSEDGGSLLRSMQHAVRAAGISPSSIGYVNAHGTGTLLNDTAESVAYAQFFGQELSQIPISSTKAALGHSLGATGALEAVITVASLVARTLPVQRHTPNPIPIMAASLVTPERSVLDKEIVMSVNIGFGGSNSALIFSRYES